MIVHVQPHAVFGREGHDLTLRVPVTFAEAALGAQVEVPTLDGGPVTLKITRRAAVEAAASEGPRHLERQDDR